MPTNRLQNKEQVPERLQNTTKNQRAADAESGRHHAPQESPRDNREESENFRGGGDLRERKSQRDIEWSRHHARHCFAQLVPKNGDQDYRPKPPMHEIAKGTDHGGRKCVANREPSGSLSKGGFRRNLRFGP